MKNINKLFSGQLLIVFVFTLLIATNLQATVYTLDLALSGQKEVPANPSTATGILIGTYDNVTNVLSFTLMFNAVESLTTAAHFHGPAAPGVNGPVLIPLAGFPTGVTSGTYSNNFTLTAEQESLLLCGMMYINIHTVVYPGGELRSQVKEGGTAGNIKTLEVAMTGKKENPQNLSQATGTFIGTFDNTTNILSFTVLFNGLAAGSTAAHIHGPAGLTSNAPVRIGFVGFPVGVTSGMYSNSYVLTAQQKAWLLSDSLYVNIHNATFPGGEIRGQLTEGTMMGNCAAGIPTMSEWALIILGFLLLTTGTIYIYRRQNSLTSRVAN